MKRLLSILVAAVLVLAAPAAAKHVTSGKVCGAGGCRTIDHPDEQLLMGGPPTSGPSSPAPFVRFRYRMGGHGERAGNIFVPAANLVLGDDGRTWMHPAALALMQRLARRVTPFPASRFPSGALAPKPAPVAAPPRVPATSDGGSSWWWALLGSPILLAFGLLVARRRGTGDRRKVYGLTGAFHGRRPGGAREAR